MDYKRIFCILALLFPLLVKGQEFVVESFENVPNDLSARTYPKADNNGRPCGLIKVYVNDDITGTSGSVIDTVINKGMEKWVYVSHDAKQIQLLFKEHMPLNIIFDDYKYPSITGKMTYLLKLRDKNNPSVKTKEEKESVLKKTDFYIEVGLGFEVREDGFIGTVPLTLPIAIGGDIRNFNIEADFSLLNIISKEHDQPYGYSELQYSAALKLGYGFIAGNRFKITPQIGYRCIFENYYGSSNDESDIYGNVTLGIRALWALSKRAGISLTPEYGFAGDDYGGFAIKAAFALTF
ncbi:MAG: hypothetical protein K2K98_08705 [Muribaculaceae bacterium]|nr:hypothetical protein [Muribaculaceae bacterium]